MNAIIPIIPAQQGEHWEVVDVGLEINKEESKQGFKPFWREGEIVSGCAIINGFEVGVVVHSGRMGSRRKGALYAIDVAGRKFTLLSREEFIDILNNIRTPIGDYIDAEYDD